MISRVPARPDAASDALGERHKWRLNVRAMTLSRLWVTLAIALPALAALAAPMSTIDLAYQIRAGDLMFDSGSVLRVDPFTFTAAGQPWTDQQWLAQVMFAGLFRIGGWPLLAISHAALVALTFGLLLAACRARGASPRVAAWLAIGAFLVAAPALGMRPQLLGLALFGLVLWLLTVRARARTVVWLVPVVAVVWANVHGSFVLAPVAVGLAWLDDRRDRRLLLVALVTGLATLINPFGVAVWTYAAGLSTNPAITRLVTEWQRTSLLSSTGAIFYSSIVLVAVLAWARRRELRAGDLLGLLAFALLGAYAERGVPWWALAAAWLLARPLAFRSASGDRRPRTSRLNAAIAAGLVIAAIVLLPWSYRTAGSGALPLLTDAPQGIADAVRATARPGDRLLAAQSWASWLELEAPGVPVLVDSRVEVAPLKAWDDYLAVSRATTGWQTLLDRDRVSLLAVSAADQPALLDAASRDPSWRSVYDGREGAVFARR